MVKARTKDRILQHLLDIKNRTAKENGTKEMSDILQISRALCTTLVQQIAEDGYIESIEVRTNDRYGPDYVCRLLDVGEVFLIDGGYESQQRRLRNSRNWKIAQNAIIAITAVLTVLIGCKTCEVTDRTNELEKQIDKLKSQ